MTAFHLRLHHLPLPRRFTQIVAMVFVIGCAALPDEDKDNSSQRIGANATVVPTSTGDAPQGSTSTGGTSTGGTTGGSSAGNTNTSTRTPTLLLDPVTPSTAVALRMRTDPTKCLSRTTSTLTEGDKLIVANCASDARQSFAAVDASFFADPNFSMKVPIPNSGVNMTIGTGTVQRAALTIFREATDAYNTSRSFIGYLSTADGSTNAGTQIIASQTQGDAAKWDLTAVGSQVRGTTLSADGCTTLCLTKSGTSPTLTRCDVTSSAQRWTFAAGCLNSDAGGYLSFDTTQNPPTLIMSSASTCSDQEALLMIPGGFEFVWPQNGSGTVYYIQGDPSTGKVIAKANAPGTGHYWIFGGTKSLH